MMKSSPGVVVDVAIFGGGIAGLWLLDRLRHEGFSAALLEADRLGAGQTIASQGIIHGGTKYTFGLMLDTAVKELKAMPETWRDSLGGSGRPDLSRARTLSPRTYMWVPKRVGSGVLGAFSRIVMRSRVQRLQRSEWPAGLDSQAAAGSVYALDEFVLDMPSVLEALKTAHRERIRRIPGRGGLSFADGEGRLRVGDISIAAQRFVLAAGAGNEELLARAGIDDVRHQRRPLHQVMVSGMKQPLYAHCVGRSARPLATITAHPSSEGDYVWYVGGLIAEDGVAETEAHLIQRAQRELPRLFPAADFGDARWATFRIDRAEGAVAGGRRPDGPMIFSRGNFIIAWPTKLALAPALSERVVQLLHRQQVRPGASQIEGLSTLPEPEVARPPWEGVELWS
jgi:glycine/D-amino acid oxidase-like deaminating enzyme